MGSFECLNNTTNSGSKFLEVRGVFRQRSRDNPIRTCISGQLGLFWSANAATNNEREPLDGPGAFDQLWVDLS
jgi:hypothetical protein